MNLETEELSKTDLLRLAAFENLYREVTDNLTAIPAELEKLKAEGKEKTARYKELLGHKLINTHIAILFKRHKISDK
jgi:hypothetical protein